MSTCAHAQAAICAVGDIVARVATPQALYLLLVTNKASNILEDLETLRLLAKVVPEYVPSMDEEGVSQAAFELLFAFDEVRDAAPSCCCAMQIPYVHHMSAWLPYVHERCRVLSSQTLVKICRPERRSNRLAVNTVHDCCQCCRKLIVCQRAVQVISLGHKDNVTVSQVKQNTEMESHEEKLHKMIIQSKINDTKVQRLRNMRNPCWPQLSVTLTASLSLSTHAFAARLAECTDPPGDLQPPHLRELSQPGRT